MITTIPLLQNVKVASPCSASWDGMDAVDGDRVHFCGECKKNVYNLSAMSQAEAEGLLRKHEGHLCVRYYRRSDGTVLTKDCPVGAQAVRLMFIRRSVAAAALMLISFGALAMYEASKPQREMGAPVAIPLTGSLTMPVTPPVTVPVPKVEPLMGAVRPNTPVQTAPVVQGFVSYHDIPVLKSPVEQHEMGKVAVHSKAELK